MSLKITVVKSFLSYRRRSRYRKGGANITYSAVYGKPAGSQLVVKNIMAEMDGTETVDSIRYAIPKYCIEGKGDETNGELQPEKEMTEF